MPFKINISDKGKTLKIESESEDLIRNKIGEVIAGNIVSPDLEGYELEITGTSDIAGFPGIKGQPGSHLRGLLLTRKDKGMNDTRKGMRLRKSIRGEEISEKTSQINMIVKKEGSKKFADLLPKKEEAPKEGETPAGGGDAKPTEEKKEEPVVEKPAEEKKEEKPTEPAPQPDEPKTSPETVKQETQPEKEPQSSEKEKEELANPDQEPKS